MGRAQLSATEAETEMRANAGGPGPETPPDTASPYAWYLLSVLVVVYMLNFIDRQIVSILVLDIKADLGLSDADMGFLGGAAFAVFYALFGIPLGRLADNWSRVRLLSCGLALWSAMTALSGFAKNGVQLGLARMGVGIGEATASPSAYSLLSDYFPKRQRATALAIYSSGLYIGGGVSLLIGDYVRGAWNAAYPGGGPLGLVGWQAAFLVVGLPGLLVALWVATLREPKRGVMDGRVATMSPTPFADFFRELATILPPLTLWSTYRRGGMPALLVNLAMAAAMVGFAIIMIRITSNLAQWSAVALGFYAVFSWANTLKARDPATFALIWGTPAFLLTALGYGLVALVAYALSYWTAPYGESVLGLPRADLALYLGGGGAAGGFLGVIMGGRLADALRARYAAGRILVIMLGVLGPIIPIAIGFTTSNATLFYTMSFVAQVMGSSALGAAAATTQDLVMPRMRGTATASFFLATTLVGLAFGPYLVGLVSDMTGTIVNGMPQGNLRAGVLSMIGIAPIAMVLLILAYTRVPAAEASVASRAAALGEPV